MIGRSAGTLKASSSLDHVTMLVGVVSDCASWRFANWEAWTERDSTVFGSTDKNIPFSLTDINSHTYINKLNRILSFSVNGLLF